MEFRFDAESSCFAAGTGSISIHRLECYDSVISCPMAKRALHKFLVALHKLTYTIIINLLEISSLILALGKLLSNYDLNLV